MHATSIIPLKYIRHVRSAGSSRLSTFEKKKTSASSESVCGPSLPPGGTFHSRFIPMQYGHGSIYFYKLFRFILDRITRFFEDALDARGICAFHYCTSPGPQLHGARFKLPPSPGCFFIAIPAALLHSNEEILLGEFPTFGGARGVDSLPAHPKCFRNGNLATTVIRRSWFCCWCGRRGCRYRRLWGGEGSPARTLLPVLFAAWRNTGERGIDGQPVRMRYSRAAVGR